MEVVLWMCTSVSSIRDVIVIIKRRDVSWCKQSAPEEEKHFYHMKMASESLRNVLPANTSTRRSLSLNSPELQLPSAQEVSEILQQMCGEISQTTTAEIVEVANSAAPRNKLQELLPVYFYSWQLQSLEAVIIHLLLHYFILWRDRDGSERREDRQALEEYIERLKTRVAELEKKLDASQSEIRKTKAELEEPDPEINRLTKQVQDLQMKNEKLQSADDEVSACPCICHSSLAEITLYSLYAYSRNSCNGSYNKKNMLSTV